MVFMELCCININAQYVSVSKYFYFFVDQIFRN